MARKTSFINRIISFLIVLLVLVGIGGVGYIYARKNFIKTGQRFAQQSLSKTECRRF
jgi:exopolysaccharide biosynthesis protein